MRSILRLLQKKAPRIATFEELSALPSGSVVIDSNGDASIRLAGDEADWIDSGGGTAASGYLFRVHSPLTVLWVPDRG